MAKLVDALPSGGSVRKDVLVRIQFWAQKKRNTDFVFFISNNHQTTTPKVAAIHAAKNFKSSIRVKTANII